MKQRNISIFLFVVMESSILSGCSTTVTTTTGSSASGESTDSEVRAVSTDAQTDTSSATIDATKDDAYAAVFTFNHSAWNVHCNDQSNAQDNNESVSLFQIFSLRHDFPTERQSFITGSGDFTAAINRDYFPYFTQLGVITIRELKLLDGQDISKCQIIGDRVASTTELNGQGKFTVVVPGDLEEFPISRTANQEIFLIIGYNVEN